MKKVKTGTTYMDYQSLSSLSPADILKRYETTAEGLSTTEAEQRLAQHGENVIRQRAQKPIVLRFLRSMLSAFNIVLLIIAVISFVTNVVGAPVNQRDYSTFIIIIVLVLTSTILSFIQNEKANRAARELRSMVTNTSSIRRDGASHEIPTKDIVIGDIINVAAGDIIAADLYFLHTKDCFISQSALTGESDGVEKFDVRKADGGSVTDLSNIAFMGTTVISGSATALVIACGRQTYIGTMTKQLEETHVKTSFEIGVGSVSQLLIRVMFVLIPFVFIANGLIKKDWGQAMLFAISLAVGITPEMLPVIMSTSLGTGAIAMAKKKTIVKNLSEIQTFGQMNVLCTDKTGTLTEDKIVLQKYFSIDGNDSQVVFASGFLNSTFQTGLKNLMDVTIIAKGHANNLDDLAAQYTCVDEIPFDFNRRRMSVVLLDQKGNRSLITKGAVEEVVKLCTNVLVGDKVVELTDELRQQAMNNYQLNNEDGLRVIAIAQKENVPDEQHFSVDDEQQLTLLGFMGFLDPPKATAKPTIESLHKRGIRCVVLTGDSLGVAKKVCANVGIDIAGAMVGEDIEKLSDQELESVVQKTSVFAKLAPDQKQRVVRTLQHGGNTVGYMGDGINDALSLKQADVGISVDTAVDIAKESAGIILLEKDLTVLEAGVIEGRKTFGNIIKYVKLAVSGNVGNMFSMTIASVILPFLPMLPIHILVQNLFCDVAQLGIPLDRVDDDYLDRPQRWETKSITQFMNVFGPLSSVFDLACFAIAWFVFGLQGQSAAQILEFQTLWFCFGILSQVIIVQIIRTNRIPFIQSRPSRTLVVSSLIVLTITLLIVFTPLGMGFSLARLPLRDFSFILILILAYIALVMVVKKIYIRHYHKWL